MCQTTQSNLAAFEVRYAARSGVTVEELHQWGRYAEPCDCGDPGCEGFQMGHQWEDAIVEDRMRAASRPATAGEDA